MTKRNYDLVGVIEKNAWEQVRVKFAVFKGDVYVDVRVYGKYSSGREYGPTPKGVCIKASKLRQLIGLLERAAELDEA